MLEPDYTPKRIALVVYEDANIRVYSDGTWKPLVMGHWHVTSETRVWSIDAGPTNLRTPWGRYKYSPITAPDGTLYDPWALAAAFIPPAA